MTVRTTARRGLTAALSAVAVLGACAYSASATERFGGIVILPASGEHMAVRDVAVVATPPADAAKAADARSAAAKGKDKPEGLKPVANLKKGETVEAFGKVGAWIAVRKDGKPLGFAPADALAPLLDASLNRTVTGTVSAHGYSCRYAIRFEGRTEVEMGPGRIADYEAAFACEKTFAKLAFHAPMFISEIPHQGGIKPIYQIALDVVGAAPDPDQVFSTILFYDREKGEVALETAFPADWLVKGRTRSKRVTDVAGAIAAAAEIALNAWGPKPWEALAKGGR